MKMFVWEDAIDVGYGGSVVVAVAETLDEARALARQKAGPLANLGEPDAILDLPVAYVYGVGGL